MKQDLDLPMNWFGMPMHITDTYICWRDKTPMETAVKLRAAWEKLAEVDENALQYMLDIARESGYNDGFDAGDGMHN